VRDRRVDEHRPEEREDDETREALPLGEGAGDQGRRDRGEHQLERGEEDERDRRAVDRRRGEADVHEPGEIEPADEPRNAKDVGVRREREREADQDPDDADEGQPKEAVHDRREDVLAPDEAAVEQGEAGQHHHDERGGDQHPGGVAAVDRRRGAVRG
jgi:hypothetical protein